MNNGAKAVVGVFLLVVLVIIGWYFLKPSVDRSNMRNTSDAAGLKGTITVASDGFVGYFPLCSARMSTMMRSAQYNFKCVDDGADYRKRAKDLRKGDVDFAVNTVYSYVLTGEDENYPGTIIAILDESKGADGIVADSTVAKNLDDLKGNTRLSIAFTPDSPSEGLLNAASFHFDIPELRKGSSSTFIESDGSESALSKFQSGDANVAVLWEPELSKALSKGKAVKLLGTESTSGLVVDVLTVNRDFAKDNPEAVGTVLSNYYRVLKHYRDNRDELIDDIADATRGLSKSEIAKMLDGIEWPTLTENAERWFGLGGGMNIAIIDAIESSVDVLIQADEFSRHPIPNSDPYWITNSSFVETLYTEGLTGGFVTTASYGAGGADVYDPLTITFDPLDDAGWGRLARVGTFKIEPITFQSGTSTLGLQGKTELDGIIERLKHYPTFRVLVRGHTDVRGDETANVELSQARADAVTRYVSVTYGVDDDRIRSVGVGGSEPLSKQAGESNRSWYYRLPRVEIHLLAEKY